MMLQINQRGAIVKAAVAAAAVGTNPADVVIVEALRRNAEENDVIAAAGEGGAMQVTLGIEAEVEMAARAAGRIAPSCAYRMLLACVSRGMRAPNGTQTKKAARKRWRV
mmetsp:Transcript_101397/g.160334  ORF Transcript_101397/g.160334 Transcript_101397/m.160334 type:complete len:109 (+) Transcript_101397:373-699(+)